MCAVLRQPKSVKLRALHSECKFGLAARSCQELLHKGCVRFQLPVSGSRLCLYEDGTEVTDDYFPGLPNDAELLLLTAGQTWQGYVSDITRFLSVFNEQHAGVIRAAQQLLSHEQDPLRQKLLADLLHHVNQNITAETREQDPSWFEGLESRFRNKSGYLRYSCESRIRGYLRETRMPVRCRVEGRPAMVDGTCPYRELWWMGPAHTESYGGWDLLMGALLIPLHGPRNGHDVIAEQWSDTLTVELGVGWLLTADVWRRLVIECRLSGMGRPQAGHGLSDASGSLSQGRIEKKRTVVPTLVEAVQDGREVNWEYFYSLLFTAKNLKLVHIACHKKTTHKLQCDRSKIYRPQAGSKKKRPARKRPPVTHARPSGVMQW
ncbi:DNA fragmentation factor subunit beta [Microtus ochrogaster]|uniref:DNAation factor subunit beta n=1 Tax=Microtus ochrogaster TaxID=79684 RepID=A0ABM1UUZ4_MICOH|nr:DNA fragmentation factor subunit beta [Microtus ochrogaster]